jgi:glyoxylase-like metal-dependent hydrolase (beta-lactamase superfamily II)
MTCFICATCGTQYASSAAPPAQCGICVDDRQAVGSNGQQWTTHDELLLAHTLRIEQDHRLLGVGLTNPFAIPQRALLVPGDGLTVLWDCLSVVTPAAVAELRSRGGIDLIAISHPHFYSSMVEWSDALGGVPILLHSNDREWVSRPSPRIEYWDGERVQLTADLALLHLPGHFPGSAALHWTDTTSGSSALLAGDSLHVAADGRHVTVMHSVPNYVPVGPDTIRELQRRLEDVQFDDLYGFTWGRNIVGDAKAAVARSLERYLDAIAPRITTAGRSTS